MEKTILSKLLLPQTENNIVCKKTLEKRFGII